jgi:hypothetical protein
VLEESGKTKCKVDIFIPASKMIGNPQQRIVQIDIDAGFAWLPVF